MPKTEDPSIKAVLWAGVLAVVGGLPRETPGTARSVGELTQDAATSAMSATYEVEQPDGSNKVYAIKVTVEESKDDRDWFWGPDGTRGQDDPAERVVVDGDHYLIGDDTNHGFRGFGGRRHDIEFHDGRKVTTRNLWHQGTVPPKWREQYPDNARFVPVEQFSPQGSGDAR